MGGHPSERGRPFENMVIDEMDEAAREATAELDANDEPMFALISAALIFDYPEQHDVLFAGGLKAATGAQSIETHALMLDRADDLESGKDRKATRKADQAALAKVAEKGITVEERKRLRKLIEVAKGGNVEPETMPVEDPGPVNLDDPHTRDMIDLYAWLYEWSETAKVVIKRRDLLIRMGLAKAKKRAKTPEKPEPSAPVLTTG